MMTLCFAISPLLLSKLRRESRPGAFKRFAMVRRRDRDQRPRAFVMTEPAQIRGAELGDDDIGVHSSERNRSCASVGCNNAGYGALGCRGGQGDDPQATSAPRSARKV